MPIEQQRERIIKWLESEDNTVLKIEGTYQGEAYIRYRYNEDLDLIIKLETSKDGHLRLKESMECEGVWSRKAKALYYQGYKLDMYLKDYIKPENSHEYMWRDINKSVKEKVEELIRPYEDSIEVSKLSNEEIGRQKYYAEDIARKQYLDGDDCENKYECEYEVDSIQSMVLRYITDRDALITELAKQYIEENKNTIRNDIIRAKLTVIELAKLNEGADIHLKTMKEIIASVPSSCRTVSVTTVIDGKELTFKSEASQLRSDCGNHYSTWYIPSSDRALFDVTYGHMADFRPEDITKITYSRKVLYERKAE